MEQQLIDALEKAKETKAIDEVSMAMIAARVTSALVEIREVTTKYLEKVEQIYRDKEMELKLGGFTLVLNTTDSFVGNKEPMQMCILGSNDKVFKNVTQIMGKL